MRKIKRIIYFILLILFVLASVTTYNGYKMYKTALNKISLKEKIENIQKDSGYVKFENIPQNFTNAIIAIEDHRFYSHGALDFISIGRAVVTNVKNMSLVEGGSTIYQQLAKNLYFTQEKKIYTKGSRSFCCI